ncbi:integrase core domain-containing protein [Microbacterium sp. IEGM 1404]|uniref:integrase core domain-containing protein n=1 Tax=Microbacterium sp. IEGM 1404 TaxID=3047084 RepID=UPI0035A907B8
MAYAEIHDDEKGTTAAGVLHRAIAFYVGLSVKVECVISDNAFAYRHPAAFRAVIDTHGITQKFIRPHGPWTNGKVERPNRTLATEWAYAQPCEFLDRVVPRTPQPRRSFSWIRPFATTRS